MRNRVSCRVLVVALTLAGSFSSLSPVAAQGLDQPLALSAPQFTSSEEYSRRGRPTMVLKSDEADAKVDKSTGVLVEFQVHKYYSLPVGADYPVNVSQAQAQQIAARFMRQWNVTLGAGWSLVPKETYLGDRGDAGKVYFFNWTKQAGGIEMPALCDITINASTGAVEGFLLVDDAVTVPLTWRLSAQDAIAAVVRAKGWTAWNLADISLHVWYRWFADGNIDMSRQLLMWRVSLRNPQASTFQDSYAEADVDAVTGEIVQFHIFGGPPPRLSAKDKAEALKRLAKQPKSRQNGKIVPPPTVFQLAKSKLTPGK